MAAPTKTAAKRATARKASPRRAATTNGKGNGTAAPEVQPPQEFKVVKAPGHPIYGDKKLYSYQPKDDSEPIVFPHISTCSPTPLFFYDNRHIDEMHQAFAWMDLCEIPTSIGRRLFLLSAEEQTVLLREWFGGLKLAPSEVGPPGES